MKKMHAEAGARSMMKSETNSVLEDVMRMALIMVGMIAISTVAGLT